MVIDKIWINKKEGEHNIILFASNTLYRINAKYDEFQKLRYELSKGIISEKFIGLPLNYIKSIEFKNDNKSLNIWYGKDSTDEIIISDGRLRNEIFEFIRSLEYFKNYKNQKPGILRRVKKPLIALGVVMGIFIYVLIIIDGMNQGYEYEVRGGGVGIGGFVLVLAQLGLMKNISIFAPLAALAIYKIYTNFKDDSEIQTLKV